MGVFKRKRTNSRGKKAEFWYIRYFVNGKDKWELVGKVGEATKDIALAKLAERKKQIRLGQLDMLKTSIPTLRAFTREYLDYQKEVKFKRSWKKDEAHLRMFNSVLGDNKLSEIQVKDIDDYKQNRVKEVKPVTVNRELEVLRHLFYLAKKWKKFFGDNPVSESGLFKTESQRIRVLTLEEEDRLLRYSSEHLLPIIKTALMTGMRQGEILSLRWEDVNLNNNLITIRAEISKSKKMRRVPVSSGLRTLLLEQKIKTIGSGYVFVTPEGVPYSPNNPSALTRTFTTARKRAGIGNFTFHDLRHTAATRMAENGASIIAVKEILGHADIKTTMKYFHPGDSLIKAVEILSNFR